MMSHADFDEIFALEDNLTIRKLQLRRAIKKLRSFGMKDEDIMKVLVIREEEYDYIMNESIADYLTWSDEKW